MDRSQAEVAARNSCCHNRIDRQQTSADQDDDDEERVKMKTSIHQALTQVHACL